MPEPAANPPTDGPIIPLAVLAPGPDGAARYVTVTGGPLRRYVASNQPGTGMSPASLEREHQRLLEQVSSMPDGAAVPLLALGGVPLATCTAMAGEVQRRGGLPWLVLTLAQLTTLMGYLGRRPGDTAVSMPAPWRTPDFSVAGVVLLIHPGDLDNAEGKRMFDDVAGDADLLQVRVTTDHPALDLLMALHRLWAQDSHLPGVRRPVVRWDLSEATPPAVDRMLTCWREGVPAGVVVGLPPCLLHQQTAGAAPCPEFPAGVRWRYGDGTPVPLADLLVEVPGRHRHVDACSACARGHRCPGIPVGLLGTPMAAKAAPFMVPARSTPGLAPFAGGKSPRSETEGVESPTPPKALRPSGPWDRQGRSPWSVVFPDLTWQAVRLGLKPAVRWVCDATARARTETEARHEGWAVTSLPVSRSPRGHLLLVEPDAASTASTWIVTCGPDPARIRDIADTEHHQLARAALFMKDEQETLLLDDWIGRLLGFPDCCRAVFQERMNRSWHSCAPALARCENGQRVWLAHERTPGGQGDWRLNTTLSKAMSLVPWAVCSFRCPPSLEYARAVWEWYRMEDPQRARVAESLLRAPRWYVSEAVQVLFHLAPSSSPTAHEVLGSYAAHHVHGRWQEATLDDWSIVPTHLWTTSRLPGEGGTDLPAQGLLLRWE